jgi:hypothetical protein
MKLRAHMTSVTNMFDRTQLHKAATLPTPEVLRYRMDNKAGKIDRNSGRRSEEKICAWAPNPPVHLGDLQLWLHTIMLGIFV